MQALTYAADKLQRGEAIETRLIWEITGAKTVKDYNANAAMYAVDAVASQAVIDNFLGSTNEFLLTGFSSTAMGTGAFGAIIDMGGQLGSLVSLTVVVRTSTDMATVAEKTLWSDATALPNTLTNNVQVSTLGNVAFHTVFTGYDGFTTGQVEVIIKWHAK